MSDCFYSLHLLVWMSLGARGPQCVQHTRALLPQIANENNT